MDRELATSGSRTVSTSGNAKRTVNVSHHVLSVAPLRAREVLIVRNQACLRCQRRRIRCDGEVPSCASCLKQETPCHYTQRKRRGPGKRYVVPALQANQSKVFSCSKQYVRMLEERLNKLASSSQRSPLLQPHSEARDEGSFENSSG